MQRPGTPPTPTMVTSGFQGSLQAPPTINIARRGVTVTSAMPNKWGQPQPQQHQAVAAVSQPAASAQQYVPGTGLHLQSHVSCCLWNITTLRDEHVAGRRAEWHVTLGARAPTVFLNCRSPAVSSAAALRDCSGARSAGAAPGHDDETSSNAGAGTPGSMLPSALLGCPLAIVRSVCDNIQLTMCLHTCPGGTAA